MLAKKFLKKMFKTETDAVPVGDDGHGNSSNDSNMQLALTPEPTSHITDTVAVSAEMLTHPGNTEIDHRLNSGGVHPNNNMFVNNTQGQVVMQFSNINGLHMGSVFNIRDAKLNSVGGGAGTPPPAQPPDARRIRKTKTVESMMQCEENVDTPILTTVAANLGEGWQFVMRQLGISDAEIEQAIMSNFVYGIKEVIYLLLLDWKRNAEENKATVGILTQALWKNGHRECVHKMKETWRSSKN